MRNAKPIPTQRGDVLILESKTTRVHAVAPVTQDGQQDFYARANVAYLSDHLTAVAAAKNVAQAGRRIFWRNVDGAGGDWSEISR
jgi:hypothetical protein